MPATFSGQAGKKGFEGRDFRFAQGRKRLGRDTLRCAEPRLKQRQTRTCKRNGQASAILGIGVRLHETKPGQAVDDPLNSCCIQRSFPPEMVLREGAGFGQTGQNSELGGCDFRDCGGEDCKMPLRHPAQDIADLVIETIVVRVRHPMAIRLALVQRKDVDRLRYCRSILFPYK